MSVHHYTIKLQVEDEILADWGNEKRPGNDPSEWNFQDIIDAVNEGLVDDAESDVVSYDGTWDDNEAPPAGYGPKVDL